MTDLAPAGPPDRDDLTPRVFRALHAGYDLHDAAGTAFAAAPEGTPWHAGHTIGEIARPISNPGHDDAAPGAPVPVPLPARPAPVPADAAASERIP